MKKQEINELKLNLASHDFYAEKCLKAEREFMELTKRDDEEEDWGHPDWQEAVKVGKSYLTLSNKYMSELDKMLELSPKMQQMLKDCKNDFPMSKLESWVPEGATIENEIVFMNEYLVNLKGTREAQQTVHDIIKYKIDIISNLIDGNGYGSYD